MTNTIHMLMKKVRTLRDSGLSFETALRTVCKYDHELMSMIGSEFGKIGGRASAIANWKRKIAKEKKYDQKTCILINSCKACMIVNCSQRTEKSDI